MTELATGERCGQGLRGECVTPTEPAGLDSRRLRQAFSCFPSGVTAVCALADGEPAGMAVSSFTTVSLTPPLVSVCIQNSSETWPRLRGRPRLGLSVLGEEQHQACRQLSAKGADRFAGLSWQAAADGAVYLRSAVAWFSCSVSGQLPAGDHTIALLEIHALRTAAGSAPLVFHNSRFRRLAPGDRHG